MENVYKIVLGDWSCDGHNQSEEVIFQTNKTNKEIGKAFEKAKKLAGVSFDCNDHTGVQLVTEYEDNKIPKSIESHFEKIGINIAKDIMEWTKKDIEEDEADDYYIEPTQLAELMLLMAKSQLSDLEYKIIDFGEISQMKGAGYGLFYQ